MDSLAPRWRRGRKSVNAVCLGCLTHGACVGHWTADYSAMEATGSASKRRWLECRHLSMPSPRPAACAGPSLVSVPDPLTRSKTKNWKIAGGGGSGQVGTEYHHGMLHAVARYE